MLTVLELAPWISVEACGDEVLIVTPVGKHVARHFGTPFVYRQDRLTVMIWQGLRAEVEGWDQTVMWVATEPDRELWLLANLPERYRILS